VGEVQHRGEIAAWGKKSKKGEPLSDKDRVFSRRVRMDRKTIPPQGSNGEDQDQKLHSQEVRGSKLLSQSPHGGGATESTGVKDHRQEERYRLRDQEPIPWHKELVNPTSGWQTTPIESMGNYHRP